jgi:hypothetical protein
VWELEAIPTVTLRHMVEDAIRSVLDIDAFEYQLMLQTEDQDQLESHRSQIKEALAYVRFDSDDDSEDEEDD